MNNEKLVKEMLLIKDPETFIKKLHGMSPKNVAMLGNSYEFVEYAGKIIKNNPEIRAKVTNGEYNPDIDRNNKLYNEGKITKEEFLDRVNKEKSNG